MSDSHQVSLPLHHSQRQCGSSIIVEAVGQAFLRRQKYEWLVLQGPLGRVRRPSGYRRRSLAAQAADIAEPKRTLWDQFLAHRKALQATQSALGRVVDHSAVLPRHARHDGA